MRYNQLLRVRPHWGAGYKRKMNRKNILRIVTIIFGISLVLIFLYISLNCYVIHKGIKVNQEIIKKQSNIELTEKQIEIASYIYTNNKNPVFKKMPLIIGIISEKNKIPYMVATFYFSLNDDRYNKITHTEWRFIVLGTSRYITKKIDYKECYNYLYSNSYFGNGIKGLKEASRFYFQKDYTELTNEEFIKISLLTLNPVFYDFTNGKNQRTDEKILEICSNIE